MSAQANPYRVGLFVIGAIALVVGGVIGFSSEDFFRHKYRYVTYFPGSVAGLREGAQVAFRGVPVGEVTRIIARYDPDTLKTQVPVYFEVAEGSIDHDNKVERGDIADEVRKLIAAGLRAKLVPQSFVTGQLYIQLEVDPDSEEKLYDEGRSGEDVIEIPAVPSTIDVLDTQLKSILGTGDTGGLKKLVSNLDKLASEENAQSLTAILKNIENFTASLEGHDTQISAILSSAETAVNDADQAIAGLPELVSEANAAVARIADVAEKLDDPETGISAVVAAARDAASSVGRMADQINNAVAENRDGLKDFTGRTLPALDDLMLDLERLAQTLNRAAEQMERDPPGFFFGRSEREGIK